MVAFCGAHRASWHAHQGIMLPSRNPQRKPCSKVSDENRDHWYYAHVLGEPASKSNSRKLVVTRGRPRFIKSDKARAYESQFHWFAKQRDPLFTEDVVLAVRVWYETLRPDLDITHIKDCLQDRAYENDRQVKAELAFHSIDQASPRCLVVVAPVSETAEVFDFVHNERYGNPFRY